MSLRKADGPLTVHVPSPGQDRPSWIGVGVVAAVGFVVGVAWPRLAGVRLGPSVPDSPTASASESAPPAPVGTPSPPRVAPAVPAALPQPVASAPASPPSAAAAAPAANVRVSVARGAGFSCKTAAGESLKGADCGSVSALDGVVLPRLRRLADCSDLAGSSGKVRLVIRADFARDALAVELGHDRSAPAAAPLLACAKSALASATLDGVAHENPRYGVTYAVTIGAPSAPDPGNAAPAAAAPSDGTAQVEWDVAIVRDAPKTGKVLARLQRGTPVHVGTSKDGWYPVKYGDGFASDGWVYRGAIGR